MNSIGYIPYTMWHPTLLIMHYITLFGILLQLRIKINNNSFLRSLNKLTKITNNYVALIIMMWSTNIFTSSDVHKVSPAAVMISNLNVYYHVNNMQF